MFLEITVVKLGSSSLGVMMLVRPTYRHKPMEVLILVQHTHVVTGRFALQPVPHCCRRYLEI